LRAGSILKGCGYSSETIQRILGINNKFVEKLEPIALTPAQYEAITELVAEGKQLTPTDITVTYDRIQGIYRKDSFNIDVEEWEAMGAAKTKKVLCLFDAHIPFHIQNIFEEITDKYSDKVDAVILGGDFFDLAMASKFFDYEEGTLKDVYMMGLDILTLLAANFRKVIMFKGNHEERLTKKQSSELRNIAYMFSGDILQNIAMGYEFENGNPIKTRNHDNVEYYDDNFVIIGDVVYQHPHDFTQESTMARRATEYWNSRFSTMGKRLSAIVTAHTHRHAHISSTGVHYIEPGCIMGKCDYLIKELKLTKKVPERGIAIIAYNEDMTFNPQQTAVELLSNFVSNREYFIQDRNFVSI